MSFGTFSIPACMWSKRIACLCACAPCEERLTVRTYVCNKSVGQSVSLVKMISNYLLYYQFLQPWHRLTSYPLLHPQSDFTLSPFSRSPLLARPMSLCCVNHTRTHIHTHSHTKKHNLYHSISLSRARFWQCFQS